MQDYQTFLASKRLTVKPSGFDVEPAALSPHLFDYQRAVVKWAIRKGKAALFLDTGLGKTITYLDAARLIIEREGGSALILSPLGVAGQIIDMGAQFDIPVNLCARQSDVKPGLNVTNYEKLHHFDANAFVAIIADEASILKSRDGKTRNYILETFKHTPYKILATATPSPNDQMELGTYAEFLGIMSYTEMLATFFCHDGGDTSQWRLKSHAESDFYAWLASWAVAMRSPADLGFDASRHTLPPKTRRLIEVTASDDMALRQGTLFAMEARTLDERRIARRASLPDRVAQVAEIVTGELQEKWIVWCDLNPEQDALEKVFQKRCVSIRGTTPDDDRLRMELEWRKGDVPILITKPSMFGHGMNWQHCARQAFTGLGDSFEQKYQAERRSHRYGQKREVYIYDVISELESAVARNQERKEAQHHAMMDGLVSHMRAAMAAELGSSSRISDDYPAHTPIRLPLWLRSEAA